MFNKYFLAFFLGLLAITLFGMVAPHNISMVLEVILDIIKASFTFALATLFFKHRKDFDIITLTTLGLSSFGFFVLVVAHIYRTVYLHVGGGFFDNSYWHYFLSILYFGIYWAVIRKRHAFR